MRGTPLFTIAIAAGFAAACTSDDATDTAGDDADGDLLGDASELVVDGGHNGGTAGFYFLPPLVNQPSYSGTFDASLSASLAVVINDLDCTDATNVGGVAKTFDTVSLMAAAEAYRVFLTPSTAGLNADACYRIAVKQSGATLGTRDVMVTTPTGDVPTGYKRLLAGTQYAIRFRIETADGGGGGGGGGGPGPTYATAHPRIYLERNKTRLTAALTTPAGVRFKSMVDSQMGGGDYWDYQQWFGALLGQLTNQASYCSYSIGEVDDYVSAEEARIASGSQPVIAADSYLDVGPHVQDIMLTYDWCYPTVTATQRTRWTNFVAQAVWNVWHPSTATWGSTTMPWSGWSINNPSNNYYYSFLTATMMFGLAAHDEHADAAQYLAFFRTDKIINQLVPTFEADLQGGGSREGTGYGTAMKNLWRIYEFWKGSTGEDLSTLTGHARASLLQMIHQTVPTRDRFAPIGDQARDSTAALFDYHREYVKGLTTLYPTDALVGESQYFLSHSSVTEMDQGFEFVWDFLYSSTAPEQPMTSLGTVFHAPGNGVVFARSGWDTDATWLNLVAGPYTESHAHRDQGSFMLYKGEWLAYDAVVSSNSGIRQDEKLHNLVRIDSGGTPIRQRTNTATEMVALDRGPGWVHMAADMTAVYGGDPAVQKVQREMLYLEPDVVIVFDRVTSTSGTQQIWMLNSPRNPAVSGTRATFTGASHTLRVERVVPAAATTSVHNLASEDGGEFTGGFRLDESVGGGTNQFLHVMWTDGAVGTVTRSDLDGKIGVVVTYGGKTATVRFGATTVDGTLHIVGGASTINETLQAGVQTMAE